jgi:hypothetical protein
MVRFKKKTELNYYNNLVKSNRAIYCFPELNWCKGSMGRFFVLNRIVLIIRTFEKKSKNQTKLNTVFKNKKSNLTAPKKTELWQIVCELNLWIQFEILSHTILFFQCSLIYQLCLLFVFLIVPLTCVSHQRPDTFLIWSVRPT